MKQGRTPLLLVLITVVSGCRAGATVAMDDLAVPDDLSVSDANLGGDGPMVTHDLACSGPAMPEICDNGCDDDRNGFADGDDPACTTQMLATAQAATPALYRLVLEPVPHVVALDGNSVPGTTAAAFRRAFSPAAYLAFDGSGKNLRRVALADGGTGTLSDFQPGYQTRDVCVFNGQLVVIERGAPNSYLHHFQPDGQTEFGTPVALANLFATACVGDASYLYVAAHDSLGVTQFYIYDKTFAQVGSPVDVPIDLQNAGLVRCIALAWTEKAGVFYGLFADNGLNDTATTASQLYPFAFDGSVGAPVDAGTWHAIGDFVP